MIDPDKYKKVNWIDGMKVNKNHFIALENHFTGEIASEGKRVLNRFNYGLLALKGDPDKQLRVDLVADHQNELLIKIDSCHAITPGGYKIDLSKKDSELTEFTLSNVETLYKQAIDDNSDLYIVITVDPYQRVPFGKADPSEYPLRMPSAVPEYKVQLIQVNKFKSQDSDSNFLILSKIQVKDNKPEIVKNYIPPCSAVDSHEKLIDFYEFIVKNLSALEANAIKIIYEINEKGSSNILTEIVSHITEDLLFFLGSNLTAFKWYLKHEPPVHVFETIVKLARLLKNSFDTRTAEEKEVLLNYFNEYFDIVPSRFRQLLDNTIGLVYDHNELYQIMEKSEDFINVISVLFNELSKMELISGQKKKEEPKRIDIILR